MYQLETTTTDRDLAIDFNSDANEDPITGVPGTYPVGTGVGAAIGAVAGGLTGKGVAEMIDPTAEEAYWRENYSRRSYVNSGASFDDYGPAYRYGVDSYGRYEGRAFEQVEADMMRNWDQTKGSSALPWDKARHAARDSWQRISDSVERAPSRDSGRDGK